MELVSEAVRRDLIPDFRESAQRLDQLAELTSDLYAQIDETIKECDGLLGRETLDTLALEIHELDNIKRWISGWPSHTTKERQAVLKELKESSFLSDKEIMGELQGAS